MLLRMPDYLGDAQRTVKNSSADDDDKITGGFT